MGISRSYQISIFVPEKQIVAIVGPSGGGKTTLLRMLAGLETIDSGQIVYNGENLPLDALEKRNLRFCLPGLSIISTLIGHGKPDLVPYQDHECD